MNLKLVAAGVAAGLGVFVLIPTSKVTSTVESITKFKTQDAYRYYKAGRSDYASWGTVSIDRAEKSGLRTAIEGRLKWLGLPHELWLPLPCLDTEDGGVICARLL